MSLPQVGFYHTLLACQTCERLGQREREHRLRQTSTSTFYSTASILIQIQGFHALIKGHRLPLVITLAASIALDLLVLACHRHRIAIC